MLIINRVPILKPTVSNKTPATDGPIKSPRANEEAHKPETSPYVVMSSDKPLAL